MKDENMRFGAYIKSKRLKDERELTLKDMSQVLGLSLSMLSESRDAGSRSGAIK